MVASKKIYDHMPEDNSNSNNGHSLLSFMNLASNKVKSALEKPNSFKRNINHRRFLQKQFRAMVKSAEKSPSRKVIARENVDSLNFTLRECNRQTYPPPLNHNFVQFDTLGSSFPYLGFECPTYCSQFARSDAFSRGNIQNLNFKNQTFERRHTTKEGDCLYQNSCSLSVPELRVEEDFLTGEELTQAIELKDLFIPETDLTQYLLNDKENAGSYCDTSLEIGNNWFCRDLGLQEDILVF